MSYQFITNAKLPTRHGEFDIHIFENADGQEHVMLTVGLPVANQTDVLNQQNTASIQDSQASKAAPIPLIRIHSEC